MGEGSHDFDLQTHFGAGFIVQQAQVKLCVEPKDLTVPGNVGVNERCLVSPP